MIQVRTWVIGPIRYSRSGNVTLLTVFDRTIFMRVLAHFYLLGLRWQS